MTFALPPRGKQTEVKKPSNLFTPVIIPQIFYQLNLSQVIPSQRITCHLLDYHGEN